MRHSVLCSLMLFAAAAAFGSNPDGNNTKFRPYFFIDEGQIAHGIGTVDPDISHRWLQAATLGVKMSYDYNDHAAIYLQGQYDILFPTYINNSYFGQDMYLDMPMVKYAAFLRRAEGVYTFGGKDQYPLQIGFGVFPYKYNTQVRNLGEYLFRGEAYPTFFNNKFDAAFNRMLGVRASTKPIKDLKIDVMLTSEMNLMPTQDFSVSGMGKYTLSNILEIGAGINLNRLFSVNENFTTPKNMSTSNLISQDTTYDTLKDANGIPIPDPNDPLQLQIKRIFSNQKYYTYKSTKAALYFCLDPKEIFGSDIFGPEDLKIYGEIAVLGFQNYGKYYGNIRERIPYMVGFNLPAFKMLDVLSFELEYFKNPYVPSWDYPVRNGVPQPDAALPDHPDPIKWSLYAKKDFGAFKIAGQIARDHLMPNVNGPVSQQERSDVLRESKDWYWMVRVGYGF